MQLFHEIPDALAIVRLPRGVYKQSKLYHRNERVFVAHSGGFVRICAHFGDTWGTSCPGVSVVDMPSDIWGLTIDKEPKYKGPNNGD